MTVRFPFLKYDPLVAVGNVIVHPVPKPETGFDWFKITTSPEGRLRKVVSKATFTDAHELSGYIWLSVNSYQRLRLSSDGADDDPVYIVTFNDELYLSDEADAVYVATFMEQNKQRIEAANGWFTAKGASTAKLHGVLECLGVWGKHVF